MYVQLASLPSYRGPERPFLLPNADQRPLPGGGSMDGPHDENEHSSGKHRQEKKKAGSRWSRWRILSWSTLFRRRKRDSNTAAAAAAVAVATKAHDSSLSSSSTEPTAAASPEQETSGMPWPRLREPWEVPEAERGAIQRHIEKGHSAWRRRERERREQERLNAESDWEFFSAQQQRISTQQIEGKVGPFVPRMEYPSPEELLSDASLMDKSEWNRQRVFRTNGWSGGFVARESTARS